MQQNVKRAVLEMIERLPDEVTLEEIAAEIFFRQQVDEGLRQLDAGEGIPHEEAMQIQNYRMAYRSGVNDIETAAVTHSSRPLPEMPETPPSA